MTSRSGIAHYALDTLFNSLVAAFPDLSCTQVQQATFAALYHQARGESLQGITLMHGVPAVVTDQGVYLQWPTNEEHLPPDPTLDLSHFTL